MTPSEASAGTPNSAWKSLVTFLLGSLSVIYFRTKTRPLRLVERIWQRESFSCATRNHFSPPKFHLALSATRTFYRRLTRCKLSLFLDLLLFAVKLNPCAKFANHLWIILRTYIYVVCTNGQYCSFKNGTMYSSMKARKVSNVETMLRRVMDNYGGYYSLRSETMIVSFPFQF